MIASTKINHAIKTQVYRWYNGYERYFTASRIKNQLELLAEDIQITTPRGKLSGKANYSTSLGDYKGMKIAHQVEEIELLPKPNGRLELSVNIIYHGIQKDGTDTCLRFSYKNELVSIPNQLPIFKSIHLSVAGAFESPLFVDTYPRLRSLALMHYYLYLIEQLKNNAADFEEILTNDFQLNLSKETSLISIEDLGNWLRNAAKKITITSHYPKNIKVKTLSRDTYELKVDFDWEGMTKANQKMIGETRHTWVIVDKKNDRFAKIKTIDVETINPFSMVE